MWCFSNNYDSSLSNFENVMIIITLPQKLQEGYSQLKDHLLAMQQMYSYIYRDRITYLNVGMYCVKTNRDSYNHTNGYKNHTLIIDRSNSTELETTRRKISKALSFSCCVLLLLARSFFSISAPNGRVPIEWNPEVFPSEQRELAISSDFVMPQQQWHS